MNTDLHNMIDVWVPDTLDTVDSPILFMVGGMGGLLPGVAYSTIFERSQLLNKKTYIKVA